MQGRSRHPPLYIKCLLDMAEDVPVLYNQARYLSVNMIKDMLRCGLNVELERFYIFPYGDFERGMSVALYGFGNVGRSFYRQLLATDGYFRRIDLFDSNPAQEEVHRPEEIEPARYDRVIICVYDEKTASAIRRGLMELSVPEDKIYWKEPVWLRDTFQFVF